MRRLYLLLLVFLSVPFLSGLSFSADNPNVIEPGKPASFNVDKQGITFSVNQNAKVYTAIKIDLPEAANIRAEAAYDAKWGEYKAVKKYEKNISGVKSLSWLLDDIPQITGNIKWVLKTNGQSAPAQITVELKELGPLPEISMGEKTGGMKIKNAGGGSISLIPDANLQLKHPDYDTSPEADMTPEGDGLAWAPPGLWTVRITGSSQKGVKFVQSNLVPVNQGKMTEIEWPVMEVSAADEKEISANIRIRKASAEAKTGTLRVAAKNGIDVRSITKESTEIFESGRKGEVTAIRIPEEPLDVVLLLDSSGSMKKDMKAVADAASKFIKNLPENASIRLIDFDTKPVPVEAKNRAELLSKLGAIKPNGATALNDSIIMGLSLEPKTSRRAIILFTDGKDANNNDTGPGSKATGDEMLAKAASSSVPVFSIGYGQAPDEVTLSRISSSTGGAYYPADEKSIDEVFSKISSILSQELEIDYSRPEVKGMGDAPAISIVIDTSGSMEESSKECKECGYKMQKAKDLVRNFILGLPPEIPVQLAGFTAQVYVTQIMTTDRQALLRGVSELASGGGTDILGASEYGFSSLENVPTSKKIMLFITDAALRVDEKRNEKFAALLGRIKDKGIFSVWTGMVDQSQEKPFAEAARLSGGIHVVSPDTAAIEKAMAEITTKIKSMPASDKMPVRAVIRARNIGGEAAAASDTILAKLPPAPVSDKKEEMKKLEYSFSDMPNQYTPEAADWIYGKAAPFRDVQITKHIQLSAEAENKAAKIKIQDVFLMKKMAGIQAPRGRQFAVLRLSLENILPEQDVVVKEDGSEHPSSWLKESNANVKTVKKIPPYLIPNLKNHIFINANSEGQGAPSDMTALTEKAMMVPGETSIFVNPGKPVEGTLLFEISDKPITTLSLHFYDTAYGHADIPLIGKIEPRTTEIKDLPKKSPEKLSDAFDLSVDGFSDSETPLNGCIQDKSAIWRTLDMSVESKVQALLDFDASSLMYLAFPTQKGLLMTRPDPVTDDMPFGFYGSSAFAPGSFNRLRQAYLVPAVLKDKPCYAFIDLRDNDVIIKAGEPEKIADAPADGVKSPGISVKVNGFFMGPDGLLGADMTLSDEKDGKATRLKHAFMLEPEGKEKPQGARKLKQIGNKAESKGLSSFTETETTDTLHIDPKTEKLMFGLKNDTVIHDGTSRRVAVLFKMPPKDKKYELKSEIIPDLVLPVSVNEKYPDSELLLALSDVKRPSEKTGDSKAVKDAIKDLMAKRKASGWTRPGSGKMAVINQNEGSGTEGSSKQAAPESAGTLPHPSITGYGASSWEAMLKLDAQAFDAKISAISCQMSEEGPFDTAFAPEAVLTQGWGRPADIARMYELYLSRNGLKSTRKTVKSDWSPDPSAEPASKKRQKLYPAIESEGKVKVFPSVPELQNLAADAFKSGKTGTDAKISVIAYTDGGGDAAAKTGDAASALGGGGKKEKGKVILETKIPLEQASLDAFDIYFPESGDGRTAVIDGIFGKTAGKDIVRKDEKCSRLEIRVEAFDRDKANSHFILLDLKTELSDIFISMGVYLPDLNEKAAVWLADSWKKAKPEKSPDDLTSLKWYSRSVIYKFIAAQSSSDKKLSEKLGVKIERADRGRIIAVNLIKSGGKLTSSIDLVRTAPFIATGDETAGKSFAIMSGISASSCEQAAIGGTGGVNLWKKGTPFGIISPSKIKKEGMKSLEDQGIPASVVARMKDTRNMILFPKALPKKDDKLSAFWFEVDPKTYETIFVLGSGYRGATEAVSLDSLMTLNSFAAGFLVGVSTSIWSVADFTLTGISSDQILEKAEELAGSVVESMNGIGGAPEYSIEGTHAKVSLSGIEFDDGRDASFGKFSDGYKAGVAYYFSKAKAGR